MPRTHEKRRHLRFRKDDRRRRITDEAANTVIHLAGFVLSLVALGVLLWLALRANDPWRILSAVIYGLSLVALYGASTLYHFSKNARLKLRLRFWDHCAIFVLIAGSYTPFLLVSLRGAWGWSIFAVIWTAALAGIMLKRLATHRANRLSTAVYLLMGWLALIAIVPLWSALGPRGFALLAAGGLAYTAGVWFFARDYRPFHHAAWHLCVLAGSIFHFLAVALYVMPPEAG